KRRDRRAPGHHQAHGEAAPGDRIRRAARSDDTGVRLVTQTFNSRGNSARPTLVGREAAEWLVALSDPECTREEREAFIAWLRRSNLHVEEFLRVSELTGNLAHYRFWPDDPVADLIASARAGNLEGVARIGTSTKPATQSSETSDSVRHKRRRISLAWAASLAIVLFALGVIAGMF